MLRKFLLAGAGACLLVYGGCLIAQDEGKSGQTENVEVWQTTEQIKEVENNIHGKIQPLLTGNIQEERVDISIANGVVILTGNVNTQKEKDNIEKEVKSTPAVKRVVNLLKIKPPVAIKNQGQ